MKAIDADWLNAEGNQAFLRALTQNGHQAFYVGGCVRNAILGVPVSDIDVATDARPEDVSRLAKTLNFAAHPTGLDHGTVTVVTRTGPLEVTTFRKDVETDGRRAVVSFADTVEDDALRRDFTMNALYADIDGQVVDPLDGLPDLLARRVQFIEDPHQRIREDYLRILRFFRFYAQFGDPNSGIDQDGLAACAQHSDGIDVLSKERIGAEMRKLLAASDPAPAIASMAQSGCLMRVLPGAEPSAMAPLVHLEGGLPGSAVRRLAALGGESPVPNLRLSKAEAKALSSIKSAVQTMSGVAELAYRYGAEIARDAVLVRSAATGQALPESFEADVAKGTDAKFPVRASDLPTLQGAELGNTLKAIENKWISSDFVASKSELLKDF